MSRLVVVLIPLFFCLKGYTHNIDEVFSSINVEGNHILIETSFPWTIREALLNFEPTLKEATSKKDFEQALFRYVQKHFLLIGNEDEKLELTEINEVKNKEHSHGNDYLFKFKGESISSIKNTILFGENKNQTNTHFYKGKVYKTSIGNEKVDIEMSNLYTIWFSVLSIIVIVSAYKIFKNKEL